MLLTLIGYYAEITNFRTLLNLLKEKYNGINVIKLKGAPREREGNECG